MGKVFEALRRAEEQRAHHSGAPAPAGAPARDSGPIGPEPASERRPLWRRLLSRRVGRGGIDDVAALNKRRIALLQPQSFVAEQFRSLRARIDSLAAARPLRTLAVTSANPGEGKTMAAVNLALVMAMSVGRKVVLVDCDLRSPRVHDSLGLQVDAGLAEVLRGTANIEDALTAVDGSSLQVLPVRALPQNPSELLASRGMRELVEKLAARFDWVVLDVPPTLGLPDAKTVTELCDGILFVVRAHATPVEDVEGALDVLDRGRVLGMILNEADSNPELYGYSG